MSDTSADDNVTVRANDTDVMAAHTRWETIRARHRAQRANTAWQTLHPYERRIVREAAAMAYVKGWNAGMIDHHDGARFGDARNHIPPDSDIVMLVLQACDAMPDLYPYLHVACGGRRRRITRKRRWPGEDPTP